MKHLESEWCTKWILIYITGENKLRKNYRLKVGAYFFFLLIIQTLDLIKRDNIASF